MKKTLLITLAVVLAISSSPMWATDESPADTNDRAAIEAAAHDYIDGWYDGDVERISRGLHPDLAKRSVRPLPNGRDVLRSLSYDSMIEYTRAGFGTKSKQENQVNQVVILDVSSVTASVKSISHEYIDYLHLAKVNGEWRIVNVLWEPNKPKEDGQ